MSAIEGLNGLWDLNPVKVRAKGAVRGVNPELNLA
jgi:hypothetical protein